MGVCSINNKNSYQTRQGHQSFYTDDHNRDFIQTLEKYFNQNILDIPEEHIDWRDKVRKLNNGKRVVGQIERLSQRFPYIPQMIVEGKQNKTINISLKEVNNLIGKSKREEITSI